ncbi:MAG: LrgB family protein [Treponema sp.]|jgi:putative effector of murein hydrolase|nr:LrgB family protein [Treponema sp.]
MEQFLSLPLCGILISIASYTIGIKIRKHIASPLTTPMLIANILVILVIIYTPVTLKQYLAGGNIITMFIGPVTVILALRIYRQRSLLRANIIPILGGCTAGSAASLFSVLFLCRLFAINETLTVSMLPKSVTTAIALELSGKNGGLAGVTVSAVIITGVFSAAFSPFFVRLFRLKDPVAVGIAIGSSGHAIGTAAALELGETEGAMSGLALGITGIITSLIFVIMFYTGV